MKINKRRQVITRRGRRVIISRKGHKVRINKVAEDGSSSEGKT